MDDDIGSSGLPTASLSTLQARARMNQQVRAFFHARDVLEVETPALSQFANTDPSIESFAVQADSVLRYLHTSPEYPMKRLLATGSPDIYQISKVWRSGEAGSKHNPEFTLLEWYRLNFSYHELMQEVSTLLHELIPDLASDDHKISYQQAFLETLGIDPHDASNAFLRQQINDSDINIDSELSRSMMLDLLMTHCVETHFQENQLTFVYDYPAEQSALARVRSESKPHVAERFEVYLGALELGNGYQELADYAQNVAVLKRENVARKANRQPEMPVDQHFLSAIKQGLPDCSGVAIGLDRVLMGICQKKTIQEVISFSWTVA